MNESRKYEEIYGNYVEDILLSGSDDDQESRSEIVEYHSPRFGESDYQEECKSDSEINEQINFTIIKDDNVDFEPCNVSSDDKYNSKFNQTISDEQLTNLNTFRERDSEGKNSIEEVTHETADEKYTEIFEEETLDNFYDENTNNLSFRNEAKENINNNHIDEINEKLEFSLNKENERISYAELKSQVKSLLEISNKHQEEVHAELDSLISENEKLKDKIELLTVRLKESDLNTSRFKLNTIALSAQLPFLRSKTMLEEDKEELNSLRARIKILESKLNEAEDKIENYKTSREKVSDLENELERVTNEFSELEKFQTEQLRVADNEIISLTEAKNTIFRELHKVMRENESLKLTKTVIKRIESYYKNGNDELVLPNIENELNESITEFKNNNDISDVNTINCAFDICQFIIPRLAFDIAEEIVISQNDSSETNSRNKKRNSLRKKNISIQVGFPLVSNSSFETSEIDSISFRSELLTLRGENNKLKKENQKLKQDMFLIKRIRNRAKGENICLQTGINNQKPVENFCNKQKEEYMLNGIKWLTSVVSEIDELEQRCGKIKGTNVQLGDNRISTGYNSTVASFEEIEHIKSNDISLKTESPLNKELNLLREKLVKEGLLGND
ncbi:hypothetical protein FG386_003360 [Cryptosporidium ryanae]|uniref:uncharacterized protein n=1 Tax=Cryptosporidium ryanae TaxID=515981 RepID=UPI003519DA57|nr:hypothetical protein FG386_003360 [Cryptosporidium ryanae]